MSRPMRSLHLAARSFRHHWQMHVAVGLGTTVGASVLTGALLVGDSMRGSLRELAIDRLGATDSALLSPRFVFESLADRLQLAAKGVGAETPASMRSPSGFVFCPLISVTGSVTQPDRGTRANGASVFGVDQRFWRFHSATTDERATSDDDRTVVLNAALATELGASVGDDVLVNFGKTADVSTETLLGRRDETIATLRLTVAKVIPSTGIGAFSLSPRQSHPKNAFIPLKTLQRASQQPDRVNTILARRTHSNDGKDIRPLDALNDDLAEAVSLEDLGLILRTNDRFRYVAIESDSIFLDPVLARAAVSTASDLRMPSSRLFAYLANSIVRDGAATGIPYSTVVGIDPEGPDFLHLAPPANEPSTSKPVLLDGEIVLNAWAAEDLGAHSGDRVTLSYFLTAPSGEYSTHTATFTVRAIVPADTSLEHNRTGNEAPNQANDPGLVPPYKGITDTENLADWNAPFPIDLSLIRRKDEDYWRNFRTTPKVFLTLADAQRLWTSGPSNSETLTAVRMYPSTAADDPKFEVPSLAIRDRLRMRLPPTVLGLTFQPVREQALHAALGSTDFSMLFLGFSGFLIAVSAMLSVLLFRLGVERRAADVGLLLGVGLTPGAVLRLLIAEALIPLVLATVVGAALAGGYAWLMLAGLRTVWSAAANAPFLRPHAEPTSYAIGAAVSLLLGVLTIAVSLRRFVRLPVNRLLRRDTESATRGRDAGLRHPALPVVLTLATAVAFAGIGTRLQALERAGCFFGSGAAAVAGFVLGLRAWLAEIRRTGRTSTQKPTWGRFGVRNVSRNVGRSILIAGLVASASFILVAVDAFRLGLEPNAESLASGTGGFSSVAEAAAPLPYDVSVAANGDSLNLSATTTELLAPTKVIPFRLRTGDSASCLNLYQKANPRILGASPAMIARGGFRFSATMPLSESTRAPTELTPLPPKETGRGEGSSEPPPSPESELANPWKLLEGTFDDGAIPAIGDEAAVLWQLKSGLGHDLSITDERGREVKLRFVGLLSNSILQGELIILDSHFRTLFPSVQGHGFFLIASPPETARKLDDALEADLAPFGFDAQDAQARLAEFQAVQNTYLSTFQLLGGLGLVLGSIGLVTILVRNVWDRRRELALLQTLGLSRGALLWYVLVENTALLIYGLAAGFASAVLAIAPGLVDGSGLVPWTIIVWVTMGSVAVTLAAGIPAVYFELRTPLLSALRNE